MKCTFSFVIAAAGLLDLTQAAAPYSAAQLQARQYKAMTYEGCYSNSGSMEMKNNTNIYNTEGSCQTVCWPLKMAVLATSNSIECWCGNKLPNSAYKVAESKCNTPCAGSDTIECGGVGHFSVRASGYLAEAAIEEEELSTTTSSTSSTPSATSGTSPAVVTVGGATITATPTSASDSDSKKSSTNVAAIAAGVVVGILAIAAIAGAAFMFMRNKKRREIEEEHKAAAAVNTFINGGKQSPTSAGSSFTDARLDPVIMNANRLSVGSIADNQDYSRRILKVTNA